MTQYHYYQQPVDCRPDVRKKFDQTTRINGVSITIVLLREASVSESNSFDNIEPGTLDCHMMKVDLKKIVEGIEFQGDESQSYLKISSGEVVLFTDEVIAAAESDEDLSVHAEWYREAIEQAREFINNEDDYIPLPSKFEFHEYSVMEEFIRSLPIEEQRDDLLSLIKGKGAFARFKQELERFLLQDKWYQYRDQALAALAKGWCRDNGIEFQ